MKKVVVLDTDIGTNPDDFFALLMLLKTENVDLKLILTGNNHVDERARLVHVILKNARRSNIQVIAGEKTGHIDFFGSSFIEKNKENITGNYVEEIKKLIDQYGEVIYINIEGCSNLALFLKTYPDYKNKLDVYHMGLSTRDLQDDFISGGTNMEVDQQASKYVYEHGLHMKVIGSQTTVNNELRVHPETSLYNKLKQSTHPNHIMLLKHLSDFYQRRNLWPALHDPLVVSVALNKDFVSFSEQSFVFDNRGFYKRGGNNKLLTSDLESKTQDFMLFCEEVMFKDGF